MLTKTQQIILDFAKENGLRAKSYSGRAMYGEHCIGIVCDWPGDYPWPKGWKMDNFGKGYIIYWPNVPWPNSYENQED